MKQQYIVYGLLCPIELKIKYIGYTKNLPKRIKMHVAESWFAPEGRKEWMEMLKQNKLRPIGVPLAQFASELKALYHEDKLIRQHGEKLFNQMNNPHRRKWWKEKISESFSPQKESSKKSKG